MGLVSENPMTWAKAWTPASVAGSVDVDVPAFDFVDDLFEDALDGYETGLHLPAVIIGAIIRKSDTDAARGRGLQWHVQRQDSR